MPCGSKLSGRHEGINTMNSLFTSGKIKGSTFRLVLTLILSLSITAGCAATGENVPTEQPSADSLSSEAMQAYNHGKYHAALKLFQEIQNRFPFSKYSRKAKLREADCHYYEGHYSQAIANYERFAQDHPSHKAMSYVLFRIGMSYARQMDTVDRDPRAAEMAEDAFNNLISRYPDSPFTAEARKQIKKARNFLAFHELYVADYYFKTDKNQQAEYRLEYLTTNYPETKPAAEAKKILADSKAGNPPEGSWLDWIPVIGLPDSSIFEGLSPGM